MQDARLIYSQRLEARRAELAWRERRHRMLGYAQLAVVACALAMVWLALAYHSLSILWALVPAAVFVTLMLVHDRLLRVAALRRFLSGMMTTSGKCVVTMRVMSTVRLDGVT